MGLRKDLHLGTSPTLGPKNQTWPTVDIFSAARQQPPLPSVTAIKPIPSTSDLPTPDKRNQPGPTQEQDDLAQKDPSLALAPKPDPANDPNNYRGDNPTQTTVTQRKGDPVGDVLDHPMVDNVVSKVQDAAGDILKKDWKKSSTEEIALGIVGAVVVAGGGVAGVAISKHGRQDAADDNVPKPKIVIKIMPTLRLWGQFWINPQPPQPVDPNAASSGPRNPNPMPRQSGPSTPPVAGEPPKEGNAPPIIYEPPGMTGQETVFMLGFRWNF